MYKVHLYFGISMDNSSEMNEKESLQKIIQATIDDVASKKIEAGHKITAAGQQLLDEARATLLILDVPDIPINYPVVISGWNNAYKSGLNEVGGYPDYRASGSAAGTATSSLYADKEEFIYKVYTFSEENKQKGIKAISNLVTFVETSNTKEKALSIMQEMGFNEKSSERLSPTEQFVIAYEAYEVPVTNDNPASTSLIPIRECISGILEDLLRRRPVEEKARNQRLKIISIGRQLKLDDIEQLIVEDWADEWLQLLDNLSSSKESTFSREQWRTLLQEATNFIIGFLSVLDIVKVNRKRG
jgi:hypothetical protein